MLTAKTMFFRVRLQENPCFVWHLITDVVPLLLWIPPNKIIFDDSITENNVTLL